MTLTNERLDELATVGVAWCNETEFAAMIEQCREANRLREAEKEIERLRKDAARWQEIRHQNGRCQMYGKRFGIWMDDAVGGTIYPGAEQSDAIVDRWIEKTKGPTP